LVLYYIITFITADGLFFPVHAAAYPKSVLPLPKIFMTVLKRRLTLLPDFITDVRRLKLIIHSSGTGA